jgi:riboflavin synthase
MFTGIITHLGTVAEKTDSDLKIKTSTDLLKKLSLGTSIAVNGICLTVVSKDKTSFTINFMPETEKKTNIKDLKQESKINLELPATAQTLLSGHIVQGHVDGIGKINSIVKKGNSYLFAFSIPKNLNKYLVEKGSISVNGISLTVISVSKDEFTVGIIPHTWENTMLHQAQVGDFVNLEVDALAKYIENLLRFK